MMSAEHDSELPITTWLEQVKEGDEQSFAQLWSHYFGNLIRLARKRVAQGPARLADEDDIVQSALASFYFNAQQGRYPDLHDRNGLWKLLLSITLTKARALSRKEGRRREILKREFAAQMTEQFEELMDRLTSDLLRQIAVAKLEGCTNQEVAERVGKSVPTVERKLRLIRDVWSSEMMPRSF
jgi:DNA-directed RNA polymerase specialized sigma24 family protein